MIMVPAIPGWLIVLIFAAPVVGATLFSFVYGLKLLALPLKPSDRDGLVLAWGLVGFAPVAYGGLWGAATIARAIGPLKVIDLREFLFPVMAITLPGMLTALLLHRSVNSGRLTRVVVTVSLLPSVAALWVNGMLYVGSALWLGVVLPSLLLCRWPANGRHRGAHVCPKCGYDLCGLTHTRCPECGRTAPQPPRRLALPRLDGL